MIVSYEWTPLLSCCVACVGRVRRVCCALSSSASLASKKVRWGFACAALDENVQRS